MCVRRCKQLCKWLSSLHLITRDITICTLHSELLSGNLLARLMQKLLPGTEFTLINERALSRKAALMNLEAALGIIWRSKCGLPIPYTHYKLALTLTNSDYTRYIFFFL